LKPPFLLQKRNQKLKKVRRGTPKKGTEGANRKKNWGAKHKTKKPIGQESPPGEQNRHTIRTRGWRKKKQRGQKGAEVLRPKPKRGGKRQKNSLWGRHVWGNENWKGSNQTKGKKGKGSSLAKTGFLTPSVLVYRVPTGDPKNVVGGRGVCLSGNSGRPEKTLLGQWAPH